MASIKTLSDLAHAFAGNTDLNKALGNMFCNNGTMYSYRRSFPIAKVIQPKNGSRFVVFQTAYCSSSTSNHQSLIQSAMSHIDSVNVHYIDVNENLNEVNCIVKFNLACLATARKPEKYIGNILYEIHKLKKASKYLKFKVLKKNDPLLYDLIKHGENYKGFSADSIAKAKKNAKKAKAEKAKKEAKAFKERLSKWVSHETNYFVPLDIHSNDTYLRVSKDSSMIETSKRLSFDIEPCRMFFKLWAKNPSAMVGEELAGYTIQECTKDYFQNGCHKIFFADAKRISKELGWN